MIRSLFLLLVNLYILVLIGRIVIDMVMSANPSWRPRGVMVVLVELTLTVTDPPLRFLRRVIPPLRIGAVVLDLSFLVLILGVQIIAPIIAGFLPA